MSLEVEPPGTEDKVPSDRASFRVIVRLDDEPKETGWEPDTWSAASTMHLTRQHHGLFAQLESTAASAADHRRFVEGFRSAVDECLDDARSSDSTHAQ